MANVEGKALSLLSMSSADIIKRFGQSAQDTGATPVQVALLTQRVNKLSQHFETNKRDHHSRRGLLKIVGQRRRLLDYLNEHEPAQYKKIIELLNLRK